MDKHSVPQQEHDRAGSAANVFHMAAVSAPVILVAMVITILLRILVDLMDWPEGLIIPITGLIGFLLALNLILLISLLVVSLRDGGPLRHSIRKLLHRVTSR